MKTQFLNLNLIIPALIVITLFSSSNLHAGWVLDSVLIPDRFSLKVNHRARYEFLNNDFRAGNAGDTDIVALRTLVHGRMNLPYGLTAGAELQDSRAEFSGNARLTTSTVNSFELLRAYLELNRSDIAGGSLIARGGRITMNIGSRRLVARNNFRNTINSFTGIDVQWQDNESAERLNLRGFWTLPVVRLPNEREKLHNNKTVFDEENFDLQFWGLFAARNILTVGRGEFYVYGLHERDGALRTTRNRQLYTPGFRLLKNPAPARFDYQLETALQFGRSHSSTTSSKELDHYAHFHHLTLGYTFDLPWSPRVVAQYDYASGDNNPNDSTNNRFDTLYGARRFEFGPTGIYGAVARTNIHTPGFRLEVKPHSKVSTFMGYRALWLASNRDAWGNTDVVDPEGKSGSYIGSQVELMIRWQVVPERIIFESGYAHLFAGEFINNAPNSNQQGDSNYAYTQISFSF
jgi:hypothetical protein